MPVQGQTGVALALTWASLRPSLPATKYTTARAARAASSFRNRERPPGLSDSQGRGLGLRREGGRAWRYLRPKTGQPEPPSLTYHFTRTSQKRGGCGQGGLSYRSRTHGGADYDFEGQIDFVTVPKFFHGEEAFGAGLGMLFGCELVKERTEGRGDFGELFPVFFDGAGPAAGDDAVFFVDVGKAGGLERTAEAVAFAEHEQAGTIGVGRGWRDGNALEDDARRCGEEGLPLFSPGDKSGAAAVLENTETFAESLAEIGKKHNAEAAGEDVEGSVSERNGFRVGFAEIDVGEASFTGEFFGERHHA